MLLFKLFIVVQTKEVRDDYIKGVKGGKLKRFSAFLADREWNTADGVSVCVCVLACVCVNWGSRSLQL